VFIEVLLSCSNHRGLGNSPRCKFKIILCALLLENHLIQEVDMESTDVKDAPNPHFLLTLVLIISFFLLMIALALMFLPPG
jgi:hypothetical protein